MGTSIKRIDVATQEIKSVSYEWLLDELPEEQKDRLLGSWKNRKVNGELELICSCTNEIQIEMNVREFRPNSYTLCTYPNQKHLHTEACNFSGGEYRPKNPYIRNWREKGDGTIRVSLNLPSMKDEEDSNTIVKDPQVDSYQKKDREDNHSKKKRKTRDYLTVFELSRKLLIRSWDFSIWSIYQDTKTNNTLTFEEIESRYPTLEKVWDKVISYETNNILITSHMKLSKITSKTGKEGSIFAIQNENKFKLPVYFLLEFISYDKLNELECSVRMRNPKTKHEYTYEVKTDLLESAFHSTNVKEGPYLITGYVKANEFGKNPLILDIALIPINSYGVVVESSYERQLYDTLCSQKRLFQRRHDCKYHPQWNGMLPDGLLLDTNKHTILEVFGMTENEVTEAYHQRKSEKMNHFSTLKNYDFWYWNAFENTPMPPIPSNVKNEQPVPLFSHHKF
ncbi:hypothetical protein CN887_21275 [Bacillus pseudomycoides]|uniref:DUF1173 family protein n=1 Tax=Bacillus pseudomycoides TaxID=64104 RepID=UPI000BEFA17C|nr:DUF1173 family protein [Bacillus pseudomycoides]PEJ23239.1 hypothetical protein CN887_21275 [Bacillus pseudomycoides]